MLRVMRALPTRLWTDPHRDTSECVGVVVGVCGVFFGGGGGVQEQGGLPAWLVPLRKLGSADNTVAAAVTVVRYLSRSYVQPQWLFDSLNHRCVRVPCA